MARSKGSQRGMLRGEAGEEVFGDEGDSSRDEPGGPLRGEFTLPGE